MKIYNTLTRQKEEFEPIEEGKVKMYVCGPTVYNYIHVGNARPYVIFDAFRRYLIHKGYEVTYVQNFTDVDDKIINKANEEGVDSSVISERYIDECLTDVANLNVLKADVHPKVTEEMKEIIEMIETLIEKGYAYEVNGSVYFAPEQFDEYGKLSNRKLEDMLAGARVEIDNEKRNPMDFVLWKPAKENEPFWKSPWGNGRPGWHIECSVMAKKYLGEKIDIHAGGEDLVFPHHENEIAQSECANGAEFAKYWMHNGFINFNNEKMSKSKGNFFTLREIAEKYGYNEVRFFILTGHYRSSLNFSDELVEASTKSLRRIQNEMEKVEYNYANNTIEKNETDIEIAKDVLDYLNKFYDALDDDFNTADAISYVFELVTLANSNANENASKFLMETFKNALFVMLNIFGVKSKVEADGEVDEVKILELIEARVVAKKDKDFGRADEIRKELLDMGIVIEDTRQGTKWSKK